MKWFLSILFPVLLHAQVGLRDPAFLASLTSATAVGLFDDATVWFDVSDSTTVFTNYSGTVPVANLVAARLIKNKKAPGTNDLRFSEDGVTAGIYTVNVSSTGLPMINNNGGNPYITTNTTALGLSATNEGVTTFVVGVGNWTGRIDESFPTLWSYPTWGFYLQATTTKKFEFIIPGGPNGSFGAIQWTNALTYAWCVRLTTNTVQCYTGLTKHSQSSWGPRVIANTTPYRIDIGDVQGASAFALAWTGYYAEFIVVPRAMSGLEITNVQNYLITKWGARTGP